MSRPLPSPDELRRFAERVQAEQLRSAALGEPDAPLPFRLRPREESEAELDAAIEASRVAAAEWLQADDVRRAQTIAADPALAAQLRELIGAPGGSWTGSADPPATALPAHNLDSEGFSQRQELTSRFSQQAIPRLGRITDVETDGALALEPNRETRRRSIDPHDGHKCCGDPTLPFGGATLVGRRTVYNADEDAMTFAKEREALTFTLRCNRWRCSCCKWRLRRRNRARAIKGALVPAGRVWFITITLDRSHELYRAFRAAELVGNRVTIKPARKRRGRPLDLLSTRLVTKPRLIGAAGVPASRLLGKHRGVIEPGGRLLRESDESAETLISIRYAAQSFNRLRMALTRHFGRRVEYYRGLELHPGDGANGGIAHLHLLVRTDSVAEWWMRYQGAGSWRAMLARAGFGVVTKVEPVRTREDAARYVTKMTAAYTSKDMAELPRWTRRGSWSRDWAPWVKSTPIVGFHWTLARAPEDAIREALTATGFALLDPADFRVPATAPP